MFHIDPLLTYILILSLAAMASAFIAYGLRLPSILTHIVAGIVIGPYVLGIVGDQELIQRLGEFGIILLLFFIGSEISLRGILKHWRTILIATVIHTIVSIGILLALGAFLDWSIGRSVVLGMVISLSSTAVLLRYLEERGKVSTKLGREITGILITQDLLVIPMILVISFLSPERDSAALLGQVLGSVIILAVIFWMMYIAIKKSRRTKIYKIATNALKNPETALFVGIVFCFGFAYLTASLHLSPGLGAFVAGMFFANMGFPEETHDKILPFKIFFMTIFFISVGLLINIPLLFESIWLVMFLVFLILVFNTIVRAILLRIIGEPWRYSFYASSLLAHVGEFSFVVAAAGYSSGLITGYGYQIAVIMIAVSILLSPLWIRLFAPLQPKDG